MSTDIDVVGRIDSLTQRKRVFVARDARTQSIAVPPPPSDDDLPVLTDVVEPENTPPESHQRDLVEPLLDALRHELSEVLRQQLATDIPELVQQATAQLAIELQQAILRRAEASMAEYLARRRQLPLQLVEQGTAAT